MSGVRFRHPAHSGKRAQAEMDNDPCIGGMQHPHQRHERADHGEQAFWSAVGLASVLGQVGLPGGGFALAYGPTNGIGGGGRF